MAAVFANTLRPVILAASRRQVLRRAAERLRVTRKVVQRFVPGETIDSVLEALQCCVIRDGTSALTTSARTSPMPTTPRRPCRLTWT